jgi:hypothetical protein
MNFLEIVLFIIGAVLGLQWFSVIILPIFYGLPKSLYWIIKGSLKRKAVLAYLISPLIWTVIFTVAAVVLVTFMPKASHYLYSSPMFYFGQWFGVIGALLKSLSKSGRQDLREDFRSATARYQR